MFIFSNYTSLGDETVEGDDGNENQNPEEYVPQVDFKPLVKLEEVEVKTGEEDEDVLFKVRCKLYRFSTETKEWKEKGAGEIKILKHKTTENTFRILMRRDQIFKLCANHRITAELKMEIVNEKQVRWHAHDYSEETQGRHELLAAKFRHEDDAKQFKSEFEKAQLASKQSSGQHVASASQPTINVNSLNSLASSLKISEGSWKCDGCLTTNKPDATKCACCEQVRVDKNATSNDDGMSLSFVCVVVASLSVKIVHLK